MNLYLYIFPFYLLLGALFFLPLIIGFVAAFFSGLFACRVMIALVRKAKLKWFGLYCALVGLAVLVFLV